MEEALTQYGLLPHGKKKGVVVFLYLSKLSSIEFKLDQGRFLSNLSG